MQIERFGADGDPRWVRACHDIHIAVGAAEHPGGPQMSRPVFLGWLAMG
jgi:hypothetical protein